MFQPENWMPMNAMPMIVAPERGADRRAEAAGQHAAADDRGDDVLELLADALAGLRATPAAARS